ncbi:MAG TPA: hypothetical protein VF975_10890, partial [Thermoanaerobaculia bacterium]
MTGAYDPFVRGRFVVDARTIEAHDRARDRHFPCDIWSPAEPGSHPLIIFSHPSGNNRRSATFLCTHLASHGYVVAALDHSEVIAAELARKNGETLEQKHARWNAVIACRVPDIRFLLDHLLNSDSSIDQTKIGIVGH